MILFLYENEDIEKIEKDHNEGKDAKIEKKKKTTSISKVQLSDSTRSICLPIQ